MVNVGSGQSVSILEVAEKLAHVMGRDDLVAEVTGKYRVGDIRDCFSDVTLAAHAPEVKLEDAAAEPATRGLTV